MARTEVVRETLKVVRVKKYAPKLKYQLMKLSKNLLSLQNP
jgi:hypothetical protein